MSIKFFSQAIWPVGEHVYSSYVFIPILARIVNLFYGSACQDLESTSRACFFG